MHNLQENDIQIGVEMAWHKMSIVREKIDLHENEIRYPMELQPLFVEVNGKRVETGFFQTVSLDNEVAVIGNPVSGKYQIIDNGQLLDMIAEAMSGIKHRVVSVGTIAARSKVFVSVELADNPFVTIAGHKTQNLINFTNGHGGGLALTANSSNVRIVCQNTFNQSLLSKGEFNFRVKHTLNCQTKLDGMEKAVDAFYGVTAEFKKAMESIAGQKCDIVRAERIAAGMMAVNGEISTRSRNNVSRISELFVNGAGNKAESIYDLFNATTDFYTHSSRGGDNVWRQFESSEFGAAATSKREWYAALTDKKRVVELAKIGDKALVEYAKAN